LISPDGSSFRWAGAGHDPPLLFDPTTNEFHEPDGGGVPLGIVLGQTYEEYTCPIGPPGSIFVTGTDGIWETADPDRELYGKDRLRDIILKHHEESSEAIGAAIITSLNEFRQSDRPLDDVTLVVIKRRQT
jgi:sigma-B regulation protein RsbU (phosphoserine phosphatase)